MPHSQRSSTRSAVCRLEWRPSRWLLVALLLLTVLSPFAVLASEMPRVFAWPLAAAAALSGWWSLRRERGRPVMALVICADVHRCTVDGRPLASLQLRWRGPLAIVTCRAQGGERRQLLFWPDVLPAPLRRELRLAAPVPPAARPATSMAP